MKIKTILTGGAAVLLLSVACKNWNSDWVQSLTTPHRTKVQPTLRFDNDDPSLDGTTAEPARQTARKGLAGVRKCRQGEQVIYTDGDCPAGSREHAVNGGAVTVVPSQRTQATVRLPSGSDLSGGRMPHAREVLLHEEGQTRLRDQVMERVINR